LANEQNLKPFPPGVSGNPAGYSRGRRLGTRLAEKLDDEAFLDVAITQALLGEFNFWRYLYEIIDGRIPKAELPATDHEALAASVEEADAVFERSQIDGNGTGEVPE